MTRVKISILFSAAERYGSFLLFLLSTAVLSRLLSPEEFGVYAILGALTALASASFQEFGGANYLIQKSDLTETNIQTAFTTTLCLSILLATVLVAFREVAARFFGVHGLKVAILASSINFFLLPFSTTVSALLRREMAFAVLARSNLAANGFASTISIGLAVLGCSYMAPVIGAVAGNAALVALLIAGRPGLRIFRPSLVGSLDVFRFGAYSSAVVIINVCYQSAPQLILGRFFDLTTVGLYGRALNATQVFDRLVIQVLNPVIMPTIFDQVRSGGDLKRIYLQSIELITVVQWPFLIFMTMMAEPLVVLWLGPKWIEIVPLIQPLCVGSLSLFAACLTYPVLVAVGRVRDTLISSLISLPPSLLLTFLASFVGVQAVAASALLTLPFQAAVALLFVGRQLSVTPADLARSTVKSGIVAACTALGVMVSVALNGFIFAVPPLGFLGAILGASAGWCLGLLLTRHPIVAEIRLTLGGIAPLARKFQLVRKLEAAWKCTLG